MPTTHMYETAEAVTKFPAQEVPAFPAVRPKLANAPASRSNNKITEFIPNRPFERLLPLVHTRSSMPVRNTEGLTLREMSTDVIEAPMGSRNPEDKIKELDRQGVEEALIIPTAAKLSGALCCRGPRADRGHPARAQSSGCGSTGFHLENRLFMTPVINLAIVDEGRRETRVHPGKRCQGRPDQNPHR